MRFSAALLRLGCCVAASLLAAGCRPYVMSDSAVDRFPKGDQEIDFLTAVEKMNAVTNNDALHAFFLLQDGDDAHVDYTARRAEAQKRGWMPGDASPRPNEAAKVGWMAMAGCEVMQVQGGLTMHLLGNTPRYATRELVFMQILPLRTENQILTGTEFVDYINRLDRMAGGNRRAKPESPLGVPAGEGAVSPGNEGAIQEGPLPASGPTEAPYAPGSESAPAAVPPAAAVSPAVPEATPAPQAEPPSALPASGPAPSPVPAAEPPATPAPESPKAAEPPRPARPPSSVPGTMRPSPKSPRPAPSQPGV